MIKERRYYFRKSVDSESVLCYNKARVKRQIMFPIYIYPPVAKLDIAADSDSEGRGFESLRAGHVNRGRNLELKNETFQIPASFSMLKPNF